MSQEARDIVFARLKTFNKSMLDNGHNKPRKDKQLLKLLFDDYNEYVSFKYSRPYSSMSCGSCVNVVTGFFQSELDKYEEKLNNAK